MATAAVPIPADQPHEVSDSATLLGGLVGTALLAYGIGRDGVIARIASVAGVSVLAATLAPRITDTIDDWTRPTSVDAVLTIDVPRPRDAVFQFFRNFENFPFLMNTLDSVEDFDDGRSRWTVVGRDGSTVQWDVIVTKYVPPRVLAWESLAGAPVEAQGTIRFDEPAPGQTRLRVEIHSAARTAEAAAAFRTLVLRRPEHRLRVALSRLDEAMRRAEEPGVHHREPAYPLPEASEAPDASENIHSA